MTASQIPLNIVFLGLSLSSSWGNGHATTYRALIRGLKAEGHRVTFLERNVPWYALHRDLADPDFCELVYYQELDSMLESHGTRLSNADAVIIGSYVPDGRQLIDRLTRINLKRLCFYDIDTPVTLAMLDRGEHDYLSPQQIPLFDAYFSFSGGSVLDRLKKAYGARRAFPLFCSVDPDLYHETEDRPYWDLGYLGTYSPDRQPTLQRLLIEPARRLPDMKFVVAGPQYPDDICWSDNVDRIEHLPPQDHCAFYNRQRFTLNVTRADMISAGWSPSVRLFEAGACKTPIISDDWQGLGELLPEGTAILIARESSDVVSALTRIDEVSRRSLGGEGQSIVLGSHTGVARARELIAALSGLPPTEIQREFGRLPRSA